MFTFAKLVNVALGTLAVGSIGGIVVPVVLGINDFLLEGDTSNWSINLGELEKTEQEISTKLSKSKVKYIEALKWLDYLKKINFQKIIELFNNLFKTETTIESKYKELKEQLENLTKLTKEEGETISKSLEVQKELKLLTHYSSIISQLNIGLHNWDKEFQKIICLLEDEKGQEIDNCNTKGWLRPLLNLISLRG